VSAPEIKPHRDVRQCDPPIPALSQHRSLGFAEPRRLAPESVTIKSFALAAALSFAGAEQARTITVYVDEQGAGRSGRVITGVR
jgi:hypothetical protein